MNHSEGQTLERRSIVTVKNNLVMSQCEIACIKIFVRTVKCYFYIRVSEGQPGPASFRVVCHWF